MSAPGSGPRPSHGLSRSLLTGFGQGGAGGHKDANEELLGVHDEARLGNGVGIRDERANRPSNWNEFREGGGGGGEEQPTRVTKRKEMGYERAKGENAGETKFRRQLQQFFPFYPHS